MQDKSKSPAYKLLLGACGVVFGDIGTSPLYAFRESFVGHHKLPVDAFHVLGVVSMLIWALILVVTVKYVFVTMRADNSGEGGSLALFALIERVTPKSRALPYIAWSALIATALFYGDAVITPAISVLSAIEGLKLINPSLDAYVLPLTLLIVAALFAVQKYGTGFVGQVFGPVMVAWFVVIGGLGLWQVASDPQVINAINPGYALAFFFKDPLQAFFTLGTVVLAVTGAEALYADMGHFGRTAIKRAWLWLALPSLLLCYLGQAALVLKTPATIDSPFYMMAPSPFLVPLIILSTAATVIASQSIISGAFSITYQAVQLGYLPRLRFAHTSTETRGQVFSGGINLILFVAVVGLILGFRSSSALASAYGLAVTATMVLTTLMIGYVVFRIWKWNLLWAAPLYALLFIIDVALLSSAMTKFMDGGWLPVAIACALVFLFATWRKGRDLVREDLAKQAIPVETFASSTEGVTRVPAVAVYLTAEAEGVPPSLLQNFKCNHVLHEHILLTTVATARTPFVPAGERVTATDIGNGIMRVIIRYGFAQPPNVPAALAKLKDTYTWLDPGKATYVISRLSVVPARKSQLSSWRLGIFSGMARIAESQMLFFRLPVTNVVELGTQVDI